MAFASHFDLQHVKRGPHTKRDIMLLDQFEESIICVENIAANLPGLKQALSNTLAFKHMLTQYSALYMTDTELRGRVRTDLLRHLAYAVTHNVRACSLHCMLEDAWLDEPWTFFRIHHDNQASIERLISELRQQVNYAEGLLISHTQHVRHCRNELQHIWIPPNEDSTSNSSDSGSE